MCQEMKVPSNSGDSCIQLDLGNSFTSSSSSHNNTTPQPSAPPPTQHPFSSSLPPPSVELSSPLRKKRQSSSRSPSPNFQMEAPPSSNGTIQIVSIDVVKDYLKDDYMDKSVHVVDCESLKLGAPPKIQDDEKKVISTKEEQILEVMRVPVECGEGEINNEELEDDEEQDNELELAQESKINNIQESDHLNELSQLKCSEQLSSGKKPVFLDFLLQSSEPDDKDYGQEAFPMTTLASPEDVEQTPLFGSPADIEHLEQSPDTEQKMRSRIDNQYQRFQQNCKLKKFKIKVSRNKSNLKKKQQNPLRQAKHQKPSNCAPVNSPVEVAEDELKQHNQSPEGISIFPNCDLEQFACNDQSADSCFLQEQFKQNKNSILAQDMFMIEEKDEEDIEDTTKENQTAENLLSQRKSSFGKQSLNFKTKSSKSKTEKRNGQAQATPVKTFGSFEESDNNDLRLISGRQTNNKSPLKSFINFTISPSQKDSWLISCSKDGYVRQFESSSFQNKVESDQQLTSQLSDSSSEAVVLRVRTQQTGNCKDNNDTQFSFATNELEKHGPMDSMTYSVSTVERSRIDKATIQQLQLQTTTYVPVPQYLESEPSKKSPEKIFRDKS